MEGYWVKGGCSEVATQRLDDDLADYWKKDEAADAAAPAVAGTETAAVAEEKKE